MTWLRHGVVEVVRFAQLAGDPYVVVEPVGWKGDAGWIARHSAGDQLRPLASAAVCEGRLAQLRATPARRMPGSIGQRRSIFALVVDFGTIEQQVEALADLYADVFWPDAEDVEVIERLERIVVVEIASVLGRDLEALRAELHERPRFRDDAFPSGKISEPSHDGGPFAVFSVERELHVTDLDGTSVRVPAVHGTWRAVWQSDDTWLAIADRAPGGARARRVIAHSKGRVYPFAVLDGAALPDALLEEVLSSCITNDVCGVGAATSNREPHLVTAWEEGGLCVAVEVHIGEGDEDDDEDDDDELVPPPDRADRVQTVAPVVANVHPATSPQPPPALPEDHRWITTFQVERTLQVTDLTNNTISLAALPGAWHAAWHDGTILVVSERVRTELPLAAASRSLTIDGPRDFALAVLDARALLSSAVSDAVMTGNSVDLLGRGIAWLPATDPVTLEIWERDGLCIAVRLS